jgi:hypothetical protein
MIKFTNWYGTLWKRILPHYWDTFWRTQYIYGEHWCWNSPQKQEYEVRKAMKEIEQDIWDNSMNHNYYPPAA